MSQYDCGDLAHVVISHDNYNHGGTVSVYVRDVDNVLNGVFRVGTYNGVVDFLYSGIMNLQAPTNSIKVLISPISLQSVWSENFLMGLAGVICASLLSYVFIKYAV